MVSVSFAWVVVMALKKDVQVGEQVWIMFVVTGLIDLMIAVAVAAVIGRGC